MERKEMQPVVGAALVSAIKQAKVAVSQDHRRRLMRCLIRCAARIAIDAFHYTGKDAAAEFQTACLDMFHEEAKCPPALVPWAGQ